MDNYGQIGANKTGIIFKLKKVLITILELEWVE